MIGLQRGTVQVVAQHPDWHDLFERERRILQQHIGHLVLDIQRVGSTAVPGLDAKPILDIAVAVASVAVIPHCVPLLCRIGYIDRGDGGTRGVPLRKRIRPCRPDPSCPPGGSRRPPVAQLPAVSRQAQSRPVTPHPVYTPEAGVAGAVFP